MRDKELSDRLLAWYDAHARDLPWRVPPAQSKAGRRPDPYRIWLSEVMLQQTTVAAVKPYFMRFTSLWPNVKDLAAAPDAEVMGEWAGLGYYARARNLLKCARVIADHYNGMFPQDRAALLGLPGIGPYTAAAIGSIAFDQPETVVDGNVERVMARLHQIATPLPAAKPELTDLAEILTPNKRPGDYAQAVMDLGATVCTPKSPTCGNCPWSSDCLAHASGMASSLPLRTPKKTKPTRFGIAYIAQRNDGAWLLERRPDEGLLGGMLGWPGGTWGVVARDAPPLIADWQDLPGEVRHTFTHFHLRLAIRYVRTDDVQTPDTGHFIPADQFRASDLPTVMRKAFDLVQNQMAFS